MAREIEHKFLVRNAPWRQGVKGTPYRQGYLSIDPERSVRVRVGGGKAFLTIKAKSEGPTRDEFEYLIPVADAEHMLRTLCIQPPIEKTRYAIAAGKLKWEIDEFACQDQGLVSAEVEVGDEWQEIVKPGWVGDDVTGDPRYFNVNLVRHPYSEWAQRGK